MHTCVYTVYVYVGRASHYRWMWGRGVWGAHIAAVPAGYSSPNVFVGNIPDTLPTPIMQGRILTL